VRYEPPEAVSPAAAAFLVESGRYERAFSAALVSLAAKDYMRVLEKGDTFTLEKLRDADAKLPPEERAVHSYLFPEGLDSTSFYGADSFRLVACYGEFKQAIQNRVTSSWIRAHVVMWLFGVCGSLIVLAPVIFAMSGLGKGMPLGSFAFAALLIFVGATSFVAALRIWPAFLRKLGTFLPGSRSARRPLNLNDAIPFFLTGTAAFGFVLLSVFTSTKLASLLGAAFAMNVFSWHFTNAPTSAGRRALAELVAYREFLSRTETDRLNRQNEPGRTPQKVKLDDAYAVALGVPCGWGEEFAANILELIQADEAYRPPVNIPEPDSSPRTLSLFDRDDK
jgi:uncharacterized protein (TIGR04222 family)